LGKIISICNQKGGVGKTTTSINLSASLAAIGKQILLIDIDPQGNATSGLGINKKSIKQNIYHVLVNGVNLNDAIQLTSVSNMALVPADVHLTGAQIELVSVLNREQRLKKAIDLIKDAYDFIIIDCPPSLGLLTINALTASDTTLIPLQCEYYAMEGLSQLLHTIKLVQDNLNPALDIEGVILTMADYRTNLTSEVINEAKNFFKEKVYKTIIPRSIRLSEAPGHGKPISEYDNQSHGAEAYRNLANEIISRNQFKPLVLQETNTSQPIVEETTPITESTEQKDIPVNTIEQDGGKDG